MLQMASRSSGPPSDGKTEPGPVEESLALLTDAVYQLVKLYLRSFCPPAASFRLAEGAPPAGSSREASGTTDHLQFTVFAVHGIPSSWVSR